MEYEIILLISEINNRIRIHFSLESNLLLTVETEMKATAQSMVGKIVRTIFDEFFMSTG
jgi:hypothetical protein